MTSSAHKTTRSSELYAHNLKLELDRAAEALDMTTQSRLNQIRQQVLVSCAQRAQAWRAWWFSGAVVAGLAFWVITQAIPLSPVIVPPASHTVVSVTSPLPEVDLPTLELLMSSEEELEILAEWDFYTWLVAEHS
ncbi:MAG: hypothetical protein WAQ53_10795 [Thiofilum sp.]|uniref:hypothetical protein n=1 Tax=Thiofilum sp. TaxID=2212733 RepID=UPI002600C91C|nr:hypothetical protein [Thiofilum sp.]MBK8453349.1 hypothetical protein [Thiofilum sp.]